MEAQGKGLNLSFYMNCFKEQQIDPQLLEMKTSQFIITHPRIENCSIGRWLGYEIFQNKVLCSSCVGKLITSEDNLQVSKEMFAF